ncbi:MAG: macro domain-containing protein [Methanomassiliicoccaceae archaeon]|nr:macro domain-containing protein [Methanomassiliicoccaceae archaeon]
MGAGIALEFKLRFPKMFDNYKERCEKNEIQVGKVSHFKDEGYTIVNFPTKQDFKYPSKIEWIESGLKDFVRTYDRSDFKNIAFPKLGTSNGGLDWAVVKTLMEKYLSDLEIDVIVCLDIMEEARGIEAKMVSIFNDNNVSILKDMLRLTKKQKDALRSAAPVKRFWHLSELDGIGITTYSKLFNICFDTARYEKTQRPQSGLSDFSQRRPSES